MELNDATVHCVAGTVLFREGDDGDRAYIIEAGVVEVSTVFRDERVILGLLGQGEIVGEMAIIDDTPRSATATVVADAQLRVVHRDQLQERLRQADPILRMLMHLMTARHRSAVRMLKRRSDVSNAAYASEPQGIGDRAIEKFRMEDELRTAIERRDLAVAYQPIVDLGSGRVVGFEALARWKHRSKGFIPPQLFIALAEETNLIRRVDEFVFSEAVRGIQRINRCVGGRQDLFVGINVSGRQLADATFLEMAGDLVRNVGLTPGLVKLEITESQIADKENAGAWIRLAKDCGCRIAIDDFGTGFSNLSQLLRLDVDTVKIDQSFVKALGAGERSEKMIQGILALACSMNLSVIVEGVENQDQARILHRLGCMLGQGFFLGCPVALQEMLENAYFRGRLGSAATKRFMPLLARDVSSGAPDAAERGYDSAFSPENETAECEMANC